MSNQNDLTANALANELDRMLPPQSSTITPTHDDPLLGVAVHFSRSPKPALSAEAKARIFQKVQSVPSILTDSRSSVMSMSFVRALVAVFGVAIVGASILLLQSPDDSAIFIEQNTNTPSVTPSATNTPSVTPSATNTPSVTPSATNTPSVTPSATNTPSVTPSRTNIPAPTQTPNPPSEQNGDFGCERPGNYCNAPGYQNQGNEGNPNPPDNQGQNNTPPENPNAGQGNNNGQGGGKGDKGGG